MKRFILAILFVVFSADALANDANPGVGRKRKIDFEDEVVEGVGNPLDSLSSLARRDRKNDPHLYRKREQFRDETDQTVMDLGVKP